MLEYGAISKSRIDTARIYPYHDKNPYFNMKGGACIDQTDGKYQSGHL